MGGGKGSTSTQSVSIPPEVLARYNSINARAEDVASTPFVPYSNDPNAFVSPLTGTQQAGIQNINALQGSAQPSVGIGQDIVAEGLRQGAPMQQQAVGTGRNAQNTAGNLYGQSLGLINQADQSGDALYRQSLGTAQQGAEMGRGLYGQSLDTSKQGLGAAAGITGAALSAIPSAVNTGNQYAGLANAYLGAGTQAVNPEQFSGDALQPYMSPYIQSVVRSQQALQEEENAKQRSALAGKSILSGAYGGDRAGIAQAELARQQSLANQSTLANILQSGYGQAANQFTQQQGINLSADQANRVAQQYGAQQAAALGQQQYGQGLGAAQAAAGLGQNLYGMTAQQAGLQQSAAAGVGSQAAQQAALQQQAAQGTFNQGATRANVTQQAAQGIGSQGAQQAALEQQAGQNLYNMGLGGGQAYAGLGLQGYNAGLQGAQAQLGAGQMEQQTGQAGLSALYNQFLQQQGFPYQQAQFLGNIAMGTGSLSGSTTTTQQPSFSDRRLKKDIVAVGKTFDGLPIYRYSMKGEDRPQLGLMAQDVEKRHPAAVGLAAGYKTVDYDEATRDAAKRGKFNLGGLAAMGGMVSPDMARQGFDDGGYAEQMPPADPVEAVAAEPIAPAYTPAYQPQTPLTFDALRGAQAFSQPVPQAPTRNPNGFYVPAGSQSSAPAATGKGPQRGATGKGPQRVGFADGGSAQDYIAMLGMSASDLARAQAAMYAGAPWAAPQERIKHTLQSPRGGLQVAAPPPQRQGALQSAASMAGAAEKLWDLGEKGYEGLGKLMGDKTPSGGADLTEDALKGLTGATDQGVDPDKLKSLFGLLGGGAKRGGRIGLASGGDAEDDEDAPLGLYAPVGRGINIPDERPSAKLNAPPGGGSHGGGGGGIGDLAAIASLGMKFLPLLLADGGVAETTDDPVKRLMPIFRRAAEESNVPLPVLLGMAKTESNYNPDAVSPTGARGVMQVLSSTAARPGYGMEGIDPASLHDPEVNIPFGAKYLAARGKAAGVTDWNDAVQRAKALTAYSGADTPQGDKGYVSKVERAMGLAPRREPAPEREPLTIAAMSAEPVRQPAEREKSWLDTLTSRDVLLPALSAIGSYMAAGSPTQAGALGAALLGGANAVGSVHRQNIESSKVGVAERGVALREAMEQRKIDAARAAAKAMGLDSGAAPAIAGAAPAHSSEWDNVSDQFNPNKLNEKAAALESAAMAAAESPEVQKEFLVHARTYRDAARAILDRGIVMTKDGRTIPIPGHSQTQAAAAAMKAEEEAKVTNRNTLVDVQPEAGTAPIAISKERALEKAKEGEGLRVRPPAQETERMAATTKAEPEMYEEFQGRQTARARLEKLAELLTIYHTGAFANEKANVIAIANSLGIPLKNTDMANPTVAQEFTKHAFRQVMDDVVNMKGRPLVAEIQNFQKANPDITLQPEANAAILADLIGNLKYKDAQYDTYLKWRKENPKETRPEYFMTEWSKSNKPRDFVDAARKEIAPMGAPLPPIDDRVHGQAYISPLTKQKGYWDARNRGWSTVPIPSEAP